MTPTIKSNLSNTYHRDGTVSYWSVTTQSWIRSRLISVADRASMTDSERSRMGRHLLNTMR